MSTRPESFGRVLRRFRAAAGLSQEALGARSGISVDAISMLERGVRSRPRNSTVVRLAAALRLQPADREALLAAARPDEGSAPPPPIPHELPRQDPDFVGRSAELAALVDALGCPVVISAINGMGGIGKSALAICAAHQFADSFPDGQLYVNLHGATPGLSPMDPLDALGRMLRSLGEEPTSIPSTVDEAAGRFRSLTADRRLLVVLDNALDADQVRPLLPGGSMCAVLITSRRVLATLEGTRSLHLDVLTDDHAGQLFGRLAGNAGIMADSPEAQRLIRLTGGLPLAIRIAGARLASRPHWPVEELTAQLADATVRVEALQAGDLAVRAAFDVSLAALDRSDDPTDRSAAAAFGLLSLPDGPDLGLHAAARLIDQNEEMTRIWLDRLLDAQLLQSPNRGRYQFHDLMRLHARRYCSDHYSSVTQAAALNRLMSFYTTTAWHTHELIRPESRRLKGLAPRWTHGGLRFDTVIEALDWLEMERANMLASIDQTAGMHDAGLAESSCQLTSALNVLFEVRNYLQDWMRANSIALKNAERLHDQPSRAVSLNDLGHAYSRVGRYYDSISCLKESMRIARSLDDLAGQAVAQSNLGGTLSMVGRYHEATVVLQESIALAREIGIRGTLANSLINLAIVKEELGRSAAAIPIATESLSVARVLGDRQLQCAGLWTLANSLASLGENELAVAHLREGIHTAQMIGSQRGLAVCLKVLARVNLNLGRSDEAIDLYRQCHVILREINDPNSQAETLQCLGDALLLAGKREEARQAWEEGFAIAEPLGLVVASQLREGLGR